MLPDINDPVWIQFVTGKKPVRSTKTTMNMFIHVNKMSYERDPSPDNVKRLVASTHSFLTQFQAIFPGEIAEIIK